MAKSVISASYSSQFDSVAADASGNIYAVGHIDGDPDKPGEYNFGNGVTLSGADQDGNAILVKYDASGDAQWAKSVTTGSSSSYFKSVAIDTAGNIYVAGHIYGTDSFNFGNGVTVSGAAGGSNVVVVKYDSSGDAQWAKTVTSASNSSEFLSVTVDSNSNIYLAGFVMGAGSLEFGGGVTVSGTNTSYNILLVKYSSSGIAQWAKSVASGSTDSFFRSVTTDNSGNVYAVGDIYNTGSFNFGNGVIVNGVFESSNLVLVKYDSSGDAQWAKSVAGGSGESSLFSATTDASGNVYVAGDVFGTDSYDFGNGVTVSGACFANNILLVKYDSSGNAEWAKSLDGCSDHSRFNSVSVYSSGNFTDSIVTAYAAGEIDGKGVYDFGNGVKANGAYQYDNTILVKYDSSGNAQWARSVSGASHASIFESVAVYSSGNFTDGNVTAYAVGGMYGDGSFDFGNRVKIKGASSSDNVLLVKYVEGYPYVEGSVTSLRPKMMLLLGSVGAVLLML